MGLIGTVKLIPHNPHPPHCPLQDLDQKEAPAAPASIFTSTSMVISIDPMVMISPSQWLWYFAATTMATGNDWKPESKWRHCQGETFASVLAQERAQNKSRERDAFLSFRLWLLPLCKVIIDIFFLKICWHIWFPNAQMCPIYHLRQRWHRNHLAVAGACRGAEYDGVATRWRLDATW